MTSTRLQIVNKFHRSDDNNHRLSEIDSINCVAAVLKLQFHNVDFLTKFADFVRLLDKDCNPGIPNLGIPAVFANPESRDWQRLNPGISGLQKLAKTVVFRVLNDKKIRIFCRLVNKIFYVR